MGMPEPGERAPDFTLPAAGGEVSLSSLRGKNVVLYFFPRADTPGCTQETMDFNRLRRRFEACNTAIIGASADPLKAQERFRSKHGIELSLAADPELKMLLAYGVWAEKQMYGRKFMGVLRTTFLIGADGRIIDVWRNVKVPGHAEDVLKAAQRL